MGVCQSVQQIVPFGNESDAAATGGGVGPTQGSPGGAEDGVVTILPAFGDGGWSDPRGWELEHVAKLTEAWRDKMELKFDVSREDLDEWFGAVPDLEGKDLDDLLDRVFAAFDGTLEGASALGIIAAFSVLCRGDLDAKLEHLFKLFDFEGSGYISEDDMTVMALAAIHGVIGYVHEGALPTDGFQEACEQFARRAFEEARATGEDVPGVNLDEFKAFVLKQFNPDEANGAARDDLVALWDLGAGEDADLAPESGELPRSEEDALFEEHVGDQFMAVKPWIGAIKEPSSPPEAVNSAPVQELALEHVHGYRGFDCRNNLFWTPSGRAVYHTAALGVILDVDSNRQRFFFGHTDDVVALAQHPGGRYFASGEMGRFPTVRVWDADSVSWDGDGGEGGPAAAVEVACIRVKSLRRAATCVAWSASGDRLAAVGQDDEHTLHVFDLGDTLRHYEEFGADGGTDRPLPAALGTSKTHGNKALACAWRGDTEIGVFGVKFACFATVGAGGGVTASRGLFGRKGKIEALLCAAALPDGTMLTGSASGRIYAWSGREVSRVARAHRGGVYALAHDADAGCVWSGGRDGLVRRWSEGLEEGGALAVAKHAAAPARVRAVRRSPGRGQLLIGTQAGQILTAPDALDGGAAAVHTSHYYGELWAVAAHPSALLVATAGDDCKVRVWDLATRACLRSADVGTWVRTLDWSPDGAHIACGTGGRLGGKIPKVNGAVLLLDAESLEVVARDHRSRRALSDVRFSPDGASLAVGSHDAKIYLYDVSGGSLSLRATCTGHSAYITHIDWSEDGARLHSNCGAYELLFWDAADGSQRTSGASELRDEPWASWTCTLGWPVQGIWPPYSDGTDVNAVHRSGSGRVAATADDFGKIKLFRWPIPDKGWAYSEYRGHSSHVTNVRFTAGDSHLVSTGGNDKSVFQWRFVVDEAALADEAECEVLEEDEDEALPEMALLEEARAAPDRSAAPDFAKMLDGEGYTGVGGGEGQLVTLEAMNVDDAVGGGEHFMAVKPWVGAVREPSDPPPQDNSPPSAKLSLEWVHGYQAQSMRNSLRVTSAGLVYTSAALGIVYDPEAHSQGLFAGHHRDDIISLGVSPCGRYVATGERGRRPAVFVWDAESREPLATLEGHHFRGVVQVAFDPTGRLLATVGLDDNHTMVLYDWRAGTRLAQQKVDTRTILGLAWAPSGQELCTVGARHVCFWELQGGGLRRRRGILGAKGKQQTLRCVEYRPSDGAALVGATDGSLYVFAGRQLTEVVAGAHAGAVDAMFVDADSGALLTGSRDGVVKRWDAASLEVAEELAVPSGAGVRSLCCHRGDAGRIVVGTGRSEVFRRGGDGEELMLMLEAHFHGETWGLAVHPGTRTFATAGDDGTVRVWDADTQMVLRSAQVDTLARALAFSADGSRLAVVLGGRLGGKERGPQGKLVVLDAETLAEVAAAHDAAEWCEDVRFSPDGATIAVASHDCKIYLYDFVDDALSLRATCTGHSSYITHIDFTEDASALQSNCGAYELLFWDDADGSQRTSGASELRDEPWASWTCTLGWPVQGVWPAASDGTDVNAVDRSHNRELLATADDFGRVKLFRYPCASPSAAFLYGLGHSSHVTNVRWLSDDSRIITLGGNDRAIFVWKVESE